MGSLGFQVKQAPSRHLKQSLAGLRLAILSDTMDASVAMDTAIRDGLPVELALALAQSGEIDIDAMIAHNVLPRKTWESALKSGAAVLTPANSERFLRVARVTALARQTFGAAKAALWLVRPTTPLGQQPPMALLATEAGARAVEQLLGRIDHGFAA